MPPDTIYTYKGDYVYYVLYMVINNTLNTVPRVYRRIGALSPVYPLARLLPDHKLKVELMQWPHIVTITA